ncbi:MAG TPA: hypothetical protein VF310_11960 [Vicinamibacteria bacterium]
MSEPAYPPAVAVAARLEQHFAQQEGLPAPDARAIATAIDAAFWASLRREEGYAARLSLTLLAPEHLQGPLRFERSLPCTAEVLTALAPAVERPGIHLGVWNEGGSLRVWGTTHHVPRSCFVLEVAAPGLLVVKRRRGEEAAKFLNVVVLEGDRVKVLDERAARLADCPAFLTTLIGFEPAAHPADAVNVYLELAVSMRAHGRGGALLVVPATAEWQESIRQPIPHPVAPPFAELAALVTEPPEERREQRWQEAFRRIIDATAGLTAVDGATVMTHGYELLAFGAKIRRRAGYAAAESAICAEPVEGGTSSVVPVSQLGGTRHQSAAQFVHDQREAVALVASQDGRFTIFAWSPTQQMVHAHRVETLLL